MRGLIKVNKKLNMPHTIHLHTNNLGVPGNYQTTLDTMTALEDLSTDGKPVAHITHIQFASFKGENWGKFKSGAEEIANYMNAHNHMTLDMGQVTFSDTTTMTADGPFEFSLYELGGHNKWVNSDVETESSGGIIPIPLQEKQPRQRITMVNRLRNRFTHQGPMENLHDNRPPQRWTILRLPKSPWLGYTARKHAKQHLTKCHKSAKKKSLTPIN